MVTERPFMSFPLTSETFDIIFQPEFQPKSSLTLQPLNSPSSFSSSHCLRPHLRPSLLRGLYPGSLPTVSCPEDNIKTMKIKISNAVILLVLARFLLTITTP